MPTTFTPTELDRAAEAITGYLIGELDDEVDNYLDEYLDCDESDITEVERTIVREAVMRKLKEQ